MAKPFRSAGLKREQLLAEMEASGDPKIQALVPKLRAIKGWTVDQVFEILCEMKGVDPGSVLSRKG